MALYSLEYGSAHFNRKTPRSVITVLENKTRMEVVFSMRKVLFSSHNVRKKMLNSENGARV